MVHNASHFAKVSESTKIEVINIEPSIIEKRNTLLDCKSIFTKSLPIKGINKMHCFSTVNGKPIGSIVTTNDAPNIASHEDSYMTGKWVLVKYEGKFYPGEVINKVDNSYSVNVMIAAGKN